MAKAAKVRATLRFVVETEVDVEVTRTQLSEIASSTPLDETDLPESVRNQIGSDLFHHVRKAEVFEIIDGSDEAVAQRRVERHARV